MAVQAHSCPGSRDNAVQLTNELTTPAGIVHPGQTGGCQIVLDACGKPLEPALAQGERRYGLLVPVGAGRIYVALAEGCVHMTRIHPTTWEPIWS
jgi:hypothetical protein